MYMLVRRLHSMVCPEALYTLGMALLTKITCQGGEFSGCCKECSRQGEAGKQGGQLQGYCPFPGMRASVSSRTRCQVSLLSQLPVLACPGSSSGEKTPEDEVRVAHQPQAPVVLFQLGLGQKEKGYLASSLLFRSIPSPCQKVGDTLFTQR